MNEVPSFNENDFDIDPELIAYFDEREKAVTEEVEEELAKEKARRLNSYRDSYLYLVNGRAALMADCLQNLDDRMKLFTLALREKMMRSYFLYHTDSIIDNAPADERTEYLAEAFSYADSTQTELNERRTGMPYIYDAKELQASIAGILLTDDTKQVKHDIEEMYDRDFWDPMNQFIRDSAGDL